MATLIDRTDWSQTPLGPIASWPTTLRTAVQILLHSRFPMFIWWGSNLINVYNDAYIPLLGKRHPDALGQSAPDIWKEVWPVIGPQIDNLFATSQPTWTQRTPFTLERNGYLETAYFTYSHSPLFDEHGTVAGVLCVCTEETQDVQLETERDLLLKQVQSERARLAEAFAQSPAFLAVLNGPNHRFEFANDRYRELVGHRDLLGKTVREAIPEVAGQGYFEILDRVFATGHPFVGTGMAVQLRRAAGQPLEQAFLDFVYQPMREPAGNVTGILVHGVDVTARVHAERSLQNSEAALRQLADAMPQIVFSADATGHVDYFNRRWYEYTGLPEGDVGYESWKQVHTADGLQRALTFWPNAVRTGEPYEIEYLLRRHDGAYRWHLGRALPIKDEHGNILRWYGTNTDIHDRKLAEAALRESDERLRLAQKVGRVGVFEWNVSTDEVYRSPELEDLYGVSPGTLSGDRNLWHKSIHPEDGARVEADLRAAIQRREPSFTFEFRVILPSGQHRWLLGQAQITYDDAGSPLRIVGVNLDISERKANEAAREQLLAAERAARAEAERASEAKSEFLATLSHELRTPLTPVLLTVSLMESHPQLPEDLRSDVAAIRRNIELESRLISDLLDLTRITRGKLQLDLADLDLHLLLRAAIDICRRESSAQIIVHLDALSYTVRGDATRLQQIFWNLLTNAQKFTPADGAITIRTSNSPGDKIRIDITDTGIGIDPDVLPRLFNAFEQGDARNLSQHAGLGLGLAISRKLAEAHHGSVSAASLGRGKGATFTVELPIIATFNPTPRSAPRPISAITAPLSILLVEDHEPTLRIMTKLLSRLGHQIAPANSVQAALSLARSRNFDLLISDLGLPDGSGIDLLRQLPQFRNRAIALTGYGMDADIAATQNAGFARHLTKPIDLTHLQSTIASLNLNSQF